MGRPSRKPSPAIQQKLMELFHRDLNIDFLGMRKVSIVI
jgi:hypothetical protein